MPLAKIKRIIFGPGPKVSRELAMKVFKRDHFKCQYCGLDARHSFEHWLVMTIDHVHPYAHGGERHMDNLMTACRPWNPIQGKRRFACFEDAKKYFLAGREGWRKQYVEQMTQVGKAAWSKTPAWTQVGCFSVNPARSRESIRHAGIGGERPQFSNHVRMRQATAGQPHV